MNTEWPINNSYAKAAKFKRFAGQYRREYVSLFANLERVIELLREGGKMGSFQIGFFRSEGEGVYRIGQTGVPSAKESRLYVFPNEQNCTMYILTIGTKDDQPDDINEAKVIVRQIKSDATEGR